MMVAFNSDMAYRISRAMMHVVTLGVLCSITRGADGMLVLCATVMCIGGMLDAAGKVALVYGVLTT